MKYFNYALPALLLLIFCSLTFAQDYSITAVVKDKFRTADASFEKLDAGTILELSDYRVIAGSPNIRTIVNGQERRLYPHLYRQMLNLGYKTNHTLPQADPSYINATAMARRNTAWQSFLGGNYQHTQQLLTTQLEADAAVLEDYMLQSVLLRQTSNEAGDMERAMLLLRKAEQEAYALSPEIHLEKAMILLRLDEQEGARRELENYRNALKKTDNGEGQADRMAWVTQMLEKLSRRR